MKKWMSLGCGLGRMVDCDWRPIGPKAQERSRRMRSIGQDKAKARVGRARSKKTKGGREDNSGS